MFTVLFTTIGRRVELVKAFKESFKRNTIQSRVYGVDIHPEMAPASYFADSVFRVPRTDSENYINELLSICSRQKVSLLIPLYEPEFLQLDRFRQRFLDVGTTLLLSSRQTIETCSDKYKTYEFFNRINIVSPHTWLPDMLDLKAEGKYLIAKPRTGMGSKGVSTVKNAEQLRNILETSTYNMLVQQYIEGIEYTVDVLTDLNGKVLSALPRQRLEVRSGEVTKSRTVDRPDIIEQAIYIVEKLEGALGPLTLQCIDNGKDICWIEINPRFGGGVPLSIAAGVDYPYMLYKMLNGERVNPIIGQYNKNFTMLRYDQSVLVEL